MPSLQRCRFTPSFLVTLALVPSALLGGCQTPQKKFHPHQELGLENAALCPNAHPTQVKIPLLSQKASVTKSF